MELYRIVNFIIQSAYLIMHFLFIMALYRRRQSTPVWFWFFSFCIALWVWVSGRFMETIVYLFFPANNTFYQFAANYQYIGDTTAGVFYLLWVLYLSGRDRLASSGWFRPRVHEPMASSVLHEARHGRACGPRSALFALPSVEFSSPACRLYRLHPVCHRDGA